MIRIWLIAGLLCALMAPAIASALTVNDVAKDVKCPTCSTPLNVSDAPVAQDMKEYIAERIAAGDDKREIIDALVVEFGPEVLAVPPKEGFDLLAWLIPLAALLVGLALVPLLGRAWRRRSRTARRGEVQASADELERLEQELRRRRS